ncbi:MAG: hypothetical protein K6F05_08175 [Succinivibrio sp.]|nr:hypothetical protein [Succinivibrio sp.]
MQQNRVAPADEVVELELEDLGFQELLIKQAPLDTRACKARSFASLQLRAKNALKALYHSKERHLLLLCGPNSLDLLKNASELCSELGKEMPIIAYAPSRFEMFGSDKENGVLTGQGTVIMPCVHLIDHPKRLGMVEACLCENRELRLILCGDATDCAQLLLMWPYLENALHADLISEFPALGGEALLGSLLAYYHDTLGSKHFEWQALRLLLGYLCRLSGDKRYLYLPEVRLKALIMEASLLSKGECVAQHDLLKALGAEDFRVNYLAEAELRDHRDRQLLIATEGEVVGQINGLSVVESAGTSFVYGEPVRITATLRAGGEGDVIDIERKAELAGQIHAKAMMIINGFLTKEFGSEQPLPVSASLVFEQSYSEIDGDSASLTGLCAVISVLSGLPVRQDLAVTGAVDQFGDVQPVGGVNEKIEGFFKICRLHGLTGSQGVIIPHSCISQLVLRPAVLKAIEQGKFHIYTVNHVKGAVKLLLSAPWGSEEDEQSVCSLILSRLDAIGSHAERRPWWQFWA